MTFLVIVINIRLKGTMMSCSDFLEFLTSDRISILGTHCSLSQEADGFGLRIYSSLATQEEILSDVRNPRESVQLIIFSFKRIFITITDDEWYCLVLIASFN